MAQSIDHLPNTAPAAEIAARVEEHGAVIIDDLLDADVLTRFNAELDVDFAQTPDGRELANETYEAFFGKQTRHLSAVAGRSRVFAEEVLIHPALLAVCDEVLLGNCANYRLNVAHVLDRGPGSEIQYPHRDEAVWPHVPHPHAPIQLASIIALEDFTTENGATRIVPGSHKWEDRQRVAEEDEFVSAEMTAGSAVIYSGATIHGGGSNTTADQRRRGMHMSYLVGWLRTEENNYLTVPLELVKTLPKRAQELLGYQSHDAIKWAGGACGLVNTFDPMVLLERGEL